MYTIRRLLLSDIQRLIDYHLVQTITITSKRFIGVYQEETILHCVVATMVPFRWVVFQTKGFVHPDPDLPAPTMDEEMDALKKSLIIFDDAEGVVEAIQKFVKGEMNSEIRQTFSVYIDNMEIHLHGT